MSKSYHMKNVIISDKKKTQFPESDIKYPELFLIYLKTFLSNFCKEKEQFTLLHFLPYDCLTPYQVFLLWNRQLMFLTLIAFVLRSLQDYSYQTKD